MVHVPPQGNPSQVVATFAGIEFSNQGWRSSSAHKEVPIVHTRREASQLCGILQWDLRVREEPLVHHSQFLRLLQRVGVVVKDDGSRHPPERADWQAPFALLPEETLETTELARIRAERAWHWSEGSAEPVATFYTASDATDHAVAWVELFPSTNGGVTRLAADRSQDPYHGPGRGVDYYELCVVVELAADICAEYDKVHGTRREDARLRIIDVLDSMIAKNIILKGHTKSPHLCPLISRLLKLNVELIPLWVSTVDNVADTPSRPPYSITAPLERARLQKCCAVIKSFLQSGMI
jgi:hypothetical protein